MTDGTTKIFSHDTRFDKAPDPSSLVRFVPVHVRGGTRART
jgi:hypothetical protein